MITIVCAVSEDAENRDRLADIQDVAEREENVGPQGAEDREQNDERNEQAEIVRSDALDQPTKALTDRGDFSVAGINS